MAEYIDRKLVLDELCRDNCERAYDGTCHNCRMTETIADFPAADVTPVRHGKWLNEDFPEKMATVHGMAICSACGELSHKVEHGYNVLSKYCPNCGAKMDKEKT